ncbi:sensor histidine kinase [Pontibacter sp. H249]|uniref:sensor histidine kinase n=1 Tax=Pontibacter sp. H249 TaxID=3133420 RepID=UPI0030BB28BB
MIKTKDKLLKDVETVKQIPIVPAMLEVICRTTGMGFAAIARVTQERWLACSVRDEVGFGLKEGGELEIETTLCNEIRDSGKLIVFDNASEDALYKDHHTPRIYGLQSYISVPIILKDGTFFGTLCAIDANPAKVNNTQVIGTFTMFAELLAFHLQSLELLEKAQKANIKLTNENKVLANANFDLDNFVYVASHDLKTPVANIQALLHLLTDAVNKEDLDRKDLKNIATMLRSSLDQFAITIKDLTTIVEAEASRDDVVPADLNLFEVVEHVKQELGKFLEVSGAQINVTCNKTPLISFPENNFKSIVYNLLSNAIKYRSPDRAPDIQIQMDKVDGKTRITFTDNGLGIPKSKHSELFTMFKRFHDHVEGSGIGLYLVKRMVEHRDGQISVNSTVGEGTTFTILL